MKTITNAIKNLNLETLSWEDQINTIVYTVDNLDLEYHPKPKEELELKHPIFILADKVILHDKGLARNQTGI